MTDEESVSTEKVGKIVKNTKLNKSDVIDSL